MSFENGVIVVIREGTSSNGTDTWKCKNASDTAKLLNGEIVRVIWQNETGNGMEMAMTDPNTFTVTITKESLIDVFIYEDHFTRMMDATDFA